MCVFEYGCQQNSHETRHTGTLATFLATKNSAQRDKNEQNLRRSQQKPIAAGRNRIPFEGKQFQAAFVTATAAILDGNQIRERKKRIEKRHYREGISM